MNPLRLPLLVGWLALSVRLAAAADDVVVMLPPLEVAAELQTTPWRYAAVGNIEVLSTCSERTTRAFIQAEHRLEQVLEAFVPVEFQVHLAVPKLIVLSEQKRTLSASQTLVTGFDPDKSAAANAGAGRADRPTAVRFMPNLRLNDPDMLAVFAMIDESRFNADQLGLTSDHVRFVLERRTPPLPAWLIEGLVRLSTQMTFERDAVKFAPAEWMSTDVTDPLRKDAAPPRTLLPMGELLEQPCPTDPEADRRWRRQAALLVRWAMDGSEERRTALWHYVRQSGAGAATEETFRHCFGLTYAEAHDRLSGFLPTAVADPVVVRRDEMAPLPDYRLRLATNSEIARIKGDWERLEVAHVRIRHPQFVTRYEEQTTRTITRYGGDTPRDPRLLAVLGLLACDLNHDDDARPLLEAAAAGRVVRPRVYVELARLRYIAALAQPGAPDGRLNAAQVNAVQEPLRTAHSQLPPLPQTYALTAELWARSGLRLGPQHLALMDEGLRLFPNQLSVLYQIAVLKLLQDSTAEAASLIERGWLLSATPAARAGFEKLRATMAPAGQTTP